MVCIYGRAAAWEMFPLPGGDAMGFIPPAVNLKAGHGLTNSLWSYYPDPTGQHRFLEQLPSFPQILAVCMWVADGRNAFFILGVFNVLTIATYVACLCSHRFRSVTIDSYRGLAIACLSLSAVAFFAFNSSAGRPEAVSAFLATAGAAALIWVPSRWQAIICGIMIGMAAALHPTHGILLGLLFATAVLLQDSPRFAFRKIGTAAPVALITFFLLFALGPYGFRETFSAVAAHGAAVNAPDYRMSSVLIYYVKLAPWDGIFLLASLLSASWTAVHIWRTTPTRGDRFLRLSALSLTFLAVWFFTIRTPNKSIYLTMFAPVVALTFFYLWRESEPHTLRRYVAGAFAAGIGCILALFFARQVCLFALYMRNGVTFGQAREQFHVLLRSNDGVIAVSESLWALSNRFDRIKIVYRGAADGDFMVVQQAQRESLTPKPVPGYELVSNNFIPRPPTLLGIRLGRTMPGYAFAIWRKKIGRDSQ